MTVLTRFSSDMKAKFSLISGCHAGVCPDGAFAWTAAAFCGASPADVAFASGNRATHEHVLQQLRARLAAASAGKHLLAPKKPCLLHTAYVLKHIKLDGLHACSVAAGLEN